MVVGGEVVGGEVVAGVVVVGALEGVVDVGAVVGGVGRVVGEVFPGCDDVGGVDVGIAVEVMGVAATTVGTGTGGAFDTTGVAHPFGGAWVPTT